MQPEQVSEKNHTTSPHTQITQPLQKLNHATSQQQQKSRNLAVLKIMQPLDTKNNVSSPQKNDATSPKNHTIFPQKKVMQPPEK